MGDVESIRAAAVLRLDHVSRRGQELADSITAWRATDPLGVTTSFSEDRFVFESRWRVDPAPFEQWALIFGDAIHHLRAMLDNCLHAIAEQEGATRRQLGAIQFPIVSDAANWADQGWHIEMLPERVRTAIENVQPFQRLEAERRGDGLAILSSLNNADKHRIILVGLIDTAAIEHDFLVSFEGGGRSVEGPPATEVFSDMVDGALSLRLDATPDRIAKVSGGGNFSGNVVVVDDSGQRHGMTSALAAIATYVPTVLDVVLAAWQPPAGA